jgi:hypothetical protein
MIAEEESSFVESNMEEIQAAAEDGAKPTNNNQDQNKKSNF